MKNARPLYPLNDFTRQVTLTVVDDDPVSPTYARPQPLVDGPVMGLITASSLPDAAALDAALEIECGHMGGGVWLAHFPGSLLTVEVLTGAFTNNAAYFVVVVPGGVRVVEELAFALTRPATLR
jgi:hypothetical protein